MPGEKWWVEASMRYGSLGEHAAWRQAIEHYYRDRLDAAYAHAQAIGVGARADYNYWFRLIEAETVTRQRSVRWHLRPWLEIEVVPEEGGPYRPVIEREVEAGVDEVARRFGWDHGAPVLITVLAMETDAPWTYGRHGFCTDKYPYEKICIPHRLLRQERELNRTIVHEYAHVMSLNASQGHAPRWLDEAISMVAERRVSMKDAQAFVSEEEPWLDPFELEGAFNADQQTEDGRLDVWLAYQQSAWIGRYLTSLKRERALVDLLRGHVEGNLWDGLQAALGKDRTEIAMRKVYGRGVMDVFRDAFEYVKQRLAGSDGNWGALHGAPPDGVS
jgi:hypothetical protein